MTRRGFDSIPNKVKALILGSALQADRPHVTEAVHRLDRRQGVARRPSRSVRGRTAARPHLKEEALRAPRILAVFICPHQHNTPQYGTRP
ncbi:hypothetical protein ABZ403_03095 [Micromonospora zamorensis]|uniref:hypothetical protein n=1 Tax=Micromonospora zamorensis TaxID=709883 RepID=UPI0033F79F7A